jgi:phage tail sheath protein FI
MNLRNRKTPGVYINEANCIGKPMVQVATAVPAFIGYTPHASYEGKSYVNIAQKITSLSQFKAIYCYPDKDKQYNPEYYLVKDKSPPEKGDAVQIGADYYSIVPDPNTIYYLYNSIQLFYENGGGDAYIVSVGTYGAPSGKSMISGDQIVNPNVRLNDLKGGLALLKKEEEPTMYICPEATLLSVAANGKLMQGMLLQNLEMGTAISIFDIIGGRNTDPITYTDDIETFRNNTGTNGLKFGTAYYPFVGTAIMHSSNIDYTNLFGGDTRQLEAVLNPADAPNANVAAILGNLDALTVSQNQAALSNASKVYRLMIKYILSDANMLPPSGALAGVITTTDNEVGPWKAPANTSIVGAERLPIKLSNSQQEDLNVDAVSGKSINVIRFFNGFGILIWGARTLDGNSLDWRYLPIRRTMIFIEQSCKLLVKAYEFEPNNKHTLIDVKDSITIFLNCIWEEGGLEGASAADSFKVQCELGSTVILEDLVEWYMKVTVQVAVVRPAEFIGFTFEQQISKS